MSVKGLVLLAMSGSIALTFLMLSCALPQYGVYWPLFVMIFYVIVPMPVLIARRFSGDMDSTSSACKELAIFFTSGIVISAFGLPIVLAHSNVIVWGSCGFVIAANIVAFLTVLGLFLYIQEDSDYEYSLW